MKRREFLRLVAGSASVAVPIAPMDGEFDAVGAAASFTRNDSAQAMRVKDTIMEVWRACLADQLRELEGQTFEIAFGGTSANTLRQY